MWVKEEEQQEPDPDKEEEDDPVLKLAMAASLVTHAAKEACMCPGLDIVLCRSAGEVQHPPPPPPWYERMAMELPLVPPLPEGLIGATPPTRASVPPAHLWALPPFIDLGDDDDNEE